MISASFALFLPPYSPDLNPIEHFWAAFNIRLHKKLSTVADIFFFANVSQCYF